MRSYLLTIIVALLLLVTAVYTIPNSSLFKGPLSVLVSLDTAFDFPLEKSLLFVVEHLPYGPLWGTTTVGWVKNTTFINFTGWVVSSLIVLVLVAVPNYFFVRFSRRKLLSANDAQQG